MKKPTDLSPILLTPGPVPLFSAVKHQLGRDMTHHRTTEITQILERLQIQLKKIFQTKEHIYILNATATGAMEAGLTNTLSEGDEVLAVSGGKFGQRWLELSEIYRLKAHPLHIPWGTAPTSRQIEEKLKNHPQIKAVLIQACETSTAVFYPIQEIARLTKDNPRLLLIVDAVTALLAASIKMDDWGIDILIGGSQKSFALPAGMSFISLSKKAQEFQKTSRLPAYYFDLKKEKTANLKGQTAFSANVSFIRALNASLDTIFEQGLENFQKKSQKMAEATGLFCKQLGLKIFSSGPSLTAVTVPEGINGLEIKKYMQKQNIIVGGGQDKLEGKIIRFGHLGNIQPDDLIQGLKALGLALRQQDSEIFTSGQLETACLKAKQILIHKKIFEESK